ncbi:hypothetical protein [Lunatimonas salinarum]|uniref:hypothetical protein n=1 Tax=Lunatimonas salinarum TaxID=1774590 RepID=UPI001AE02E06|nr:hypothetical protein [Lunatimonas salinarum]
MKNVLPLRRRIGFGIFMLVYFLALCNSSFFLHSHWKNGRLVALHAHPSAIGSADEDNKERDTHSNEEYALYDLIYNTPALELAFFEFGIHREGSEVLKYFPGSFNFFLSEHTCFHDVRGPPCFAPHFEYSIST